MVGDQAGEPTWVTQLVQHLEPLSTTWAPSDRQEAAVLALLSLEDAPDLVLTVRAADLAHHAGQISLPGGRREPGDRCPSETALRETHEEIDLPPTQVRPIGQMRPRELAVSANRVIPVVGVWSGQETIAARDGNEVEMILRWPISLLASPKHRLMAHHPIGGHGPAWQIDDLFLWGFTGYLVDALLRLGGWQQDWDKDQIVDVPARFQKP